MRTTTSDLPLRLATFEWLEEQSAIHGEVLPWSVLLAGFVHEGVRVPLVSMQGIFTPRAGRLPLTIRTAVGGPYADAFAANGLLLYKYRGTDPFHRDNEGLRQAMRERAPLILAVDRVNTEAIVMLVEDAATEHRLDWTAIVHPVPEGEPARITLETNATGAVLGTFYEGEPVKIYADGQVMTL